MKERDVAAALVLVERFAAGGHDPIVDHYGRFHYGLSSLPSVARGCVTSKGQPLVFLDIACSQPFFLGLLHLASRRQPSYFDDWKRLEEPEDYLNYEIDGDFLNRLSILPESPTSLSSPRPSAPQNEDQRPENQEEEGEEVGVGSLRWGFRDSDRHISIEDKEKGQEASRLEDQGHDNLLPVGTAETMWTAT